MRILKTVILLAAGTSVTILAVTMLFDLRTLTEGAPDYAHHTVHAYGIWMSLPMANVLGVSSAILGIGLVAFGLLSAFRAKKDNKTRQQP